jgi:hypothetical protein
MIRHFIPRVPLRSTRGHTPAPLRGDESGVGRVIDPTLLRANGNHAWYNSVGWAGIKSAMTRTPRWQILRHVNPLVVPWVFAKKTIIASIVLIFGLELLRSMLWGLRGGPSLSLWGWSYAWYGALLDGGFCAIRLVRTKAKNTLPYRRWQEGKCIYCGYDLTGNVTGVCPECGKPM